MSKFRAFSDGSTRPDKGFQMTFKNGLTISVCFGNGNYCEYRNRRAELGGCVDAEVMVWDAEGKGLFADGGSEFDDDGNCIIPNADVGWKSTDDVARMISAVAGFPVGVSKKDVVLTLNRL